MGTVLKDMTEVMNKPFTEQVQTIIGALEKEFPPEYWLSCSSNEALWVAMLTLCGPRNVAQVVTQCQVVEV